MPSASLTFTRMQSQTIKIVRGNPKATVKNQDGTYDVAFDLSETPERQWTELFQNTWAQTGHGGKRPSRIEVSTLFLVCPVNEIEKLVPHLKQAVEDANVQHRKWTERFNREKEQKLAAEREEQRKLEEAFRKLDLG